MGRYNYNLYKITQKDYRPILVGGCSIKEINKAIEKKQALNIISGNSRKYNTFKNYKVKLIARG